MLRTWETNLFLKPQAQSMFLQVLEAISLAIFYFQTRRLKFLMMETISWPHELELKNQKNVAAICCLFLLVWANYQVSYETLLLQQLGYQNGFVKCLWQHRTKFVRERGITPQ